MATRGSGGKKARRQVQGPPGAALIVGRPEVRASSGIDLDRDAAPLLEGLTEDELERATRDLVDRINEIVGIVGQAHDRLANYLFRVLFGTDAEAALDPDKRGTRAYALLSERSGRSLDLSAKELSEHVRVGALNFKARDDGWANTDWSKKLELLPLLAHEHRWKKLAAGVRKANAPNVGVRVLRAWVQVALGKRGEGEAQGSLQAPQGSKLVELGYRLEERANRAVLVERTRKLAPKRRREFVKGLRETAKNLALLIDEIEQDGE